MINESFAEANTRERNVLPGALSQHETGLERIPGALAHIDRFVLHAVEHCIRTPVVVDVGTGIWLGCAPVTVASYIHMCDLLDAGRFDDFTWHIVDVNAGMDDILRADIPETEMFLGQPFSSMPGEKAGWDALAITKYGTINTGTNGVSYFALNTPLPDSPHVRTHVGDVCDFIANWKYGAIDLFHMLNVGYMLTPSAFESLLNHLQVHLSTNGLIYIEAQDLPNSITTTQIANLGFSIAVDETCAVNGSPPALWLSPNSGLPS